MIVATVATVATIIIFVYVLASLSPYFNISFNITSGYINRSTVPIGISYILKIVIALMIPLIIYLVALILQIVVFHGIHKEIDWYLNRYPVYYRPQQQPPVYAQPFPAYNTNSFQQQLQASFSGLPVEPAAGNMDFRTCSSCGGRIPENYKFCPYCGKQV